MARADYLRPATRWMSQCRHKQKRATSCGQCRCYNKTLATLAPIPPIELTVDDLATFHLDIIALEHGYLAPTSLGVTHVRYSESESHTFCLRQHAP
jgi:hypothetical protein